jgi:hypothetical protein
MNEADYLYEQACQASDLKGHVGLLADHELRKLRFLVKGLIHENGGKATGIPGIVMGACVMDAARRFFEDTGRKDTGHKI